MRLTFYTDNMNGISLAPYVQHMTTMKQYHFGFNPFIGLLAMIPIPCVSDTTNFGHGFLTLRWYRIIPAKVVLLNSSQF